MTDTSDTKEPMRNVEKMVAATISDERKRKGMSELITPSPRDKKKKVKRTPKKRNKKGNEDTLSSDDDNKPRAINYGETPDDLTLTHQNHSRTEKEAALDEQKKYRDTQNDLSVANESIALIRTHATLRNISSGILMKLMKLGYTDFEMLGYFRSTESNSFDKLSDVALLTSHILMKKEGTTDQEEDEYLINHKLTCLLIRDDNNNFRICTEEKLLSEQVGIDFATKYNEFNKIISIDKHYKLPHYDTWKRYMKCYWRIVNWYIENILHEQWFIENESIEFCKTKLLKRTQRYDELTEQISGFVNSLLVFGVKDNEKGIRTLSNLKGGVTLWLSKCTRKLWKINSGSVDHRYKLIIEENNMVDDNIYNNVSTFDDHGNSIVRVILGSNNKLIKKLNKTNEYERFLRTFMRSPRFSGVSIITTPCEENQNFVMNLRVQDFIYKLIEDDFQEKGAPVYLTVTPNNVQLARNKSIVNVKIISIQKKMMYVDIRSTKRSSFRIWGASPVNVTVNWTTWTFIRNMLPLFGRTNVTRKQITLRKTYPFCTMKNKMKRLTKITNATQPAPDII